MRFQGVDIPSDVLSAQEEGRLVVFAGAGVSIPSPSNYPDFDGLVKAIGGATGELAKDPFEVLLGQFLERGIDVHARAQKLLSNPDSKPHRLHYSIVKLFSSAATVRIVTTNFDSHLTAAAKESFGDRVENFAAPVLPLGRDFSGIVYLHGSVDGESRHLVLTDDDFGRAYLTDGWARRFLRDLFSEYAVLFIGYSHGDTVLKYLARGLPPKSHLSRFAFAKEGDQAFWRYLRVTPVPYPLNQGAEDKHRVLADALERWAHHARLGALARRERIHRLLEEPPPIDPDDEDFLVSTLQRTETIRFFAEPTVGPEWLDWVSRKGFLDPLLSPEGVPNEGAGLLATWIADKFVLQHPEAALRLVHGRRHLNPVLWNAIAWQLWHSKDVRQPQVVTKWLSILLNEVPSGRRSDLLSFLLESCKMPEDFRAAPLLFQFLTTPRLRLRPTVGESRGRPNSVPEIEIEGDVYWLDRSWEQLFRPHLSLFAHETARVTAMHLRHARNLLRSFGAATERFDLMSFHRSAIERHPQDSHRREADVLIDAARDSLAFLLSDSPEVGQFIVREWADSESLLLKRLAVHAMSQAEQMSADSKLEWVISRGWLYRAGLKHEVFRLLAQAYPHASEHLRQAVIDSARQGIQGEEADLLGQETVEYEKFNLLTWLTQVSPSCELAAAELKRLKRENPNFAPREHPDFSHWTESGYVAPTGPSPASVEALLELDPHDDFEEILGQFRQKARGQSTEDRWYESDSRPLGRLSDAVAKDPEWGLALGEALKDAGTDDDRLWQSIFHGFQRATFEPGHWPRLMTLLAVGAGLGVAAWEFTQFLEDVVKGNRGTLPTGSLDQILAMSAEVWRSLSSTEENGREDTWADRLTAAINDPAGQVARIWLHGIARQREEAEDCSGLPEPSRLFFEDVLSERTHRGLLFVAVLASQAEYLFALDPAWTKARLLPVFSWSDERRAAHAWHGFAHWGRLSQPFVDELMPYYLEAFDHMDALNPVQDSFIRQLALMAMLGSRSPLVDGWLDKFLARARLEERTQFAGNIAHLLRNSATEAALKEWSLWLKEYWDRRINGIPIPIDAEELEEMIEWTVYLSPVFEEAVDRVCGSPPPLLQHTGIFSDLARSDLPRSNPDALLRLVRHLLNGVDSKSFLHCTYLDEIARSLAASGANRSGLYALSDRLAEIGCIDTAARLKSLLDGSDTESS